MRTVWLALVLLVCIASPGRAEPRVVKINDLIEQASEYDGKLVTVQGEAIGDVMIRGEFGWVNISDGSNDIGVWAPAEALRAIRFVGRYHTRGDTLRVSGEFRRADPEHGGDLDLRAAEIQVARRGEVIARPTRPGRLPLAAGALALGGALGLWLWLKGRRLAAGG